MTTRIIGYAERDVGEPKCVVDVNRISKYPDWWMAYGK
jgi:hypothetical protein